MKRKFLTILSALIVFSTLLSQAGFSVLAQDTDPVILTEDSLYVLKDNFIYDVILNTNLDKFLSNLNSPVSVYNKNGIQLTSIDRVSTGCYFTQNETQYYVVVAGDVDSSGTLNSTDLSLVKNRIISSYSTSESEKRAMDINQSNIVDSTDYLMLKMALIGATSLHSSEEYYNKKFTVAQILNSIEQLSIIKEYDTDIKISVDAEEASFDLNGSYMANYIGSAYHNFSYILNATSQGVTYPITETYYGDGTLYTQQNGVKYKVEASYPEVSKFLSEYLVTSPINSEGEFILIPNVDSDKILDNFVEISKTINNISLDVSNNEITYNISTSNILSTSLLNESLNNSIGSNSYGSIIVEDYFDSIKSNWTITTNSYGIMYDVNVTFDMILSEEGMMYFGAQYPQNITATISLNFKNMGNDIIVSLPDASEYITLDNIYTQFAFVAYNNVFDMAPAISSTYTETLTMGSESASIISEANGKNTISGIEFNEKSDITVNNADQYKNIYIGNGKYITDNNGIVSSIDVETGNQTISKMGSFFTPHYNSFTDINKIIPGILTEKTDSYTLNYELTKDYAISFLENSEIFDLSTFENNFGVYGSDSIELKNSSCSISYSKISHELISNTVSFTFILDGTTTLTYSYSFEINSVDYNNITVDNSLNN